MPDKMSSIDNLRTFLQQEPFNLKKAAEQMGISPKVLSDFVNRTYNTKTGIKYCGLGEHESTVVDFFSRLGYSEKENP